MPQDAHCSSREPSAGAPLSRFTLRLAAYVALGAFLLPFVFGTLNLSLFYLLSQDRWLLLAMALLIILCSKKLPPRPAELSAPNWVRWAGVAGLIIVCFAGHHWLLSGYDLSRDEQMAVFDARVFASGKLVEPLAGLWRADSDALNTLFMYPAELRSAWISSYLPMNAALRAALDWLAVAELTGPLMTALGAVALWGCVRKIWPDEREAPWVAALLYCGSGQILFLGMTAYAMPAHLALNMAWLWLLLQRSRWGDVAALAVAFIAVGLHQPIFHPLFAGPILCLLLWQREWQRAVFFIVGYALISLFWMLWPTWTWAMVQAVPNAVQPIGVDFMTRLTDTLTKGDPQGLQNMGANLLRFVAWQHLLFLPLMLMGLRIVSTSPLAAALAGGVMLTLLTMTIILPYQGHGFGYRYLNGLIGNGILLGVFGWVALAEKDRWRRYLVRTSIATALIILPAQAWIGHRSYAPHARADAQIAALEADYVIITPGIAPFTQDLVLNPPGLDERPIRLFGPAITPALIQALCPYRPNIVFIGREILQPIANAMRNESPQDVALERALRDAFGEAGCVVRHGGGRRPS